MSTSCLLLGDRMAGVAAETEGREGAQACLAWRRSPAGSQGEQCWTSCVAGIVCAGGSWPYCCRGRLAKNRAVVAVGEGWVDWVWRLPATRCDPILASLATPFAAPESLRGLPRACRRRAACDTCPGVSCPLLAGEEGRRQAWCCSSAQCAVPGPLDGLDPNVAVIHRPHSWSRCCRMPLPWPPSAPPWPLRRGADDGESWLDGAGRLVQTGQRAGMPPAHAAPEVGSRARVSALQLVVAVSRT